MTTGIPLDNLYWTEVGEQFSGTEALRAQARAAIRTLEWQTVDSTDEELTLPAMQGLAIQEAIKQLRVPKVVAFAWNGALPKDEEHLEVPHDDGYALYGIEAEYANGRARIYLVDEGSTLTPLAAHFLDGAL